MSNNTPDLASALIHPSTEVEQHSLLKSIIMHLLPGIPITLFYILVAPFFVERGFPPVFALCLALVVVVIPVELGFLLYLGKKANGRLSLKGIVLYREGVITKYNTLTGRSSEGLSLIPGGNAYTKMVNGSYDARYWGFVPRGNVEGRPILIYFSYEPDSWHALPFLTRVRWARIFSLPE
jgi:hypothetical protein